MQGAVRETATAVRSGLRVIGPVRGSSGYDRHTREFVRQFVARGVPVQLTQLLGWSADLPPGQREEWFDRLADPVEGDVALHFTMPVHAQPRPGLRNVNYTMFEADRLPAAWAERAADHELIVVPTTAARDAWTASGVDPCRLAVSPLGVDGAWFTEPAVPLPLEHRDGTPLRARTRFLNVADPRPRKNHVGILRAWLEATRPGDDAVLILKLPAVSDEHMRLFATDVAALERECGRTLADAAPVALLAQTMTEQQVRSLYAAATHYLSLSHGEGWDQPMMEAACAGLRLIAPRHTAYLDYLTDDDAVLLDARLADVRIDLALGREDVKIFAGLRWWEPDHEQAVAAVRAAIDGSERERRSPAARIAAEYDWARSAGRLLDLLQVTA